MKLYWVTFARPSHGCGVTAVDEADCRALLENNAFFDGRSITSVAEIRNFEELDQDHVVPNMGNMLARGIWFPKGVSSSGC